jgi:hypothetical protein
MSKILGAKLIAVLERRSEASASLKGQEDLVLVQRGRPRLLVMKCPCGCGDELTINLDREAGKAWRIYKDREEVTLFPSVWRDTGCESHFIIWRGKTYLFGKADEDFGWYEDDALLEKHVLGLLSDELVQYVEIADALNAIPWDVQFACRSLVKKGKAVEGKGDLRGWFRKSALPIDRRA